MRTLDTGRLVLRPWREEDAEDLFAYARNPAVGPAAGWKPHADLDESRRILAHFIAQGDVWAIEEKESGQVVGSFGLHADDIRRNDRARMIGYVLREESWSRGYMTEAVRAVLRHAFEDLGLELVSVRHYPFNERSRRVIEKAGFRYEGTLRRAIRRYDGVVLDDCCWSMTREEYFLSTLADERKP
ncbi:MAG: GNAT family N-acetyltransferase [Clostridia bacterium]|nr:GNAT family N-acetyltransferase [Clostridia bacterium]